MKRILDTIQEVEKLNTINVIDELGPGGANHLYSITRDNDEISTIQFQCGPRNEKKSIKGVLDVDLLEIVRDRLISFQNGPFNSKYNAEALVFVEAALKALNQRVLDRVERGVLGKNEK